MTDYAKSIVRQDSWPAPKRSSFIYSMSQKERIEALAASGWPKFDWSNEWVALFEQKDFDRQMSVDARSGVLQEAFNIRTAADIQNKEDGKAYLKKLKTRCNQDDRFGTPLSAIECREDGKYIKGTDASLRTWFRYEDEARGEEFFEEYDVPPEIEEKFRQ